MRPFGLALSVCLLAIIQPAWAPASGAAEFRVLSHPEYGKYLANGRGLALYRFSADRQGSAETEPLIRCRGTCLEIWTPLSARGKPVAGSGVNSKLLGSVPLGERTIVTYGGWPLYKYLVDNESGDVTGHGIESFNGVWQLVRPKGAPVALEQTVGF